MLKVYTRQLLTPEQVAKDEIQKTEEILYREFNSDVLTGVDVVEAMSVIIDEPGWEVIEEASASSRKMETMTVTRQKKTERFDKMALITNGRNSIYILDWEEHSTVVRHDPVVKVVGPDANEIADTICNNMLLKLVGNLVKISLNNDIAKDVAGLINVDISVINSIKDDLEASAEQAINDLMNLHDKL